MIAPPHFETTIPTPTPERTDRTLRSLTFRRPRTLAAAFLLIVLLGITAGGPLAPFSTHPTFDVAAAAVTTR